MLKWYSHEDQVSSIFKFNETVLSCYFPQRWNWLPCIFKGLNTAVVHNMSTNFLYHLQIVHLQSSVLVEIYFAKLLQNVFAFVHLSLVTIYCRILFSEAVPCLKYKYQKIIIRENKNEVCYSVIFTVNNISSIICTIITYFSKVLNILTRNVSITRYILRMSYKRYYITYPLHDLHIHKLVTTLLI